MYMINCRNILAGALLTLAASPSVYADRLSADAGGYYARAVEMFGQYNYTGAIDQLNRYLRLSPSVAPASGSERIEATLLLMRASLLNGESDRVESLYDSFSRLYAGSLQMPQAQALMADAYFFRGDYAAAVNLYETLDLEALPSGHSAETRYHYAVALTRRGFFDRAEEQFDTLIGDADYDSPARFYKAYIYYVRYDYARALNAFRALPEDVAGEFGADFYIAQILFAGGRWQEVVNMEQSLLVAARHIDASDLPALAEAYRLLGESLYNMGNLQAAEPALKEHIRLAGDDASRSAKYMAGVIACEEADYEEARRYFNSITADGDNLAQSAWLYLGQIAMRDKDYTTAAICFDRAARMNVDSNVAETALYNYAAATVSGGRVPFGSASELLEEFGRRYPDSTYAAAVDEYLAAGYMAEHRYETALNRFERIKNPTPQIRKAMQTCLYELGCQALSDGDYSQAEQWLRAAVSNNSDPAVTAQCNLWLGDALYGGKKYASAISAYNAYLNAAPRNDANRGLALYNAAYACYNNSDYTRARSLFAEAYNLTGAGRLSSSLRTDALLRQADCDNYTGNVAGALALYETAVQQSDTGADYAAFQAACMQGVMGNQKQKAADLTAMIDKWPSSTWVSSALYELAQAYVAEGNVSAARNAQDRLAALYPDSEMLRESRLSMAGAYSSAGNTDEAIAECRAIITEWPSSKQARTASEYLQSLYSRRGQMGEYLAFINSVPGAPKPDVDAMDRQTYMAAIDALEDNPADDRLLLEYLRLFPSGAYVPDATLSLAEVYRANRNTDKAVEMLDTILTRYPDSDAAPNAMLAKADILLSRTQYADAAALYQDLLRRGGTTYTADAYYGLIQSTTDPETKLAYIERYLALPALDEDARSAVIREKALLMARSGSYAEAEQLLLPLCADTWSASGAEAAVELAGVYLKQNKPQKAVELMNSFTAAGCEDSYWLARGYIVLADAYAAAGSKAKARSYITALKANYPGDDAEIVNMINDRLSRY